MAQAIKAGNENDAIPLETGDCKRDFQVFPPALPSSQGPESSFMRECSALEESSQTGSGSAGVMAFAQHSGAGASAG